MRRITFLSALLILSMFTLSFAEGWVTSRIPSGVETETFFVDAALGENNDVLVKGLWIPEKLGGAYWYTWNSGWNVNNMEEHDAYYFWFNGGDWRETDTNDLYTIIATYDGTHLYKYTGGAGNQWREEGEIAENDYYRWHDAAFFDVAGDGAEPQNCFVVSSISHWSPNPLWYKKGLFYVTDGTAPSAEAEPIPGSLGEDYSFLYRDLISDNVIYCYYNYQDPDVQVLNEEEAHFQKLVITYDTGLQIYDTDLDDDFDVDNYSLIKVHSFYQYKDGNYRHQYLCADTQHDTDEPNTVIWYRNDLDNSLTADEWDPILTGVDGSMGIVANVRGDNEHNIYLATGNNGVSYHRTGTSGTQAYLNARASTPYNYLKNLNLRSLSKNPWYTSGDIQLAVGGSHTGFQFLNVEDVDAPSVEEYLQPNGWGTAE